MQINDKGLASIARHVGFVSQAYRDSAGVLTIGYGFTMGSRIIGDYWQTRYGRGLAPNDGINRADADALLRRLVDDEYGAAVRRSLPGLLQHQFDAACSVAYSLGSWTLGWRWAQELKVGDGDVVAEIPSGNYNTAGGRRLTGLAVAARKRRGCYSLAMTGTAGPRLGGRRVRPARMRRCCGRWGWRRDLGSRWGGVGRCVALSRGAGRTIAFAVGGALRMMIDRIEDRAAREAVCEAVGEARNAMDDLGAAADDRPRSLLALPP